MKSYHPILSNWDTLYYMPLERSNMKLKIMYLFNLLKWGNCTDPLTVVLDKAKANLMHSCHVFQVLLIEIEGPTVIFTENIQSAISSGIISLQFATCSLHNFEKNVLIIATKDSSVLSLESDTGKTLSASIVHPKTPSKALFMDILGKT